MRRFLSTALAAGTVILAGSTTALAMGGGGGDMPSASQPSYDPAVDYAKGVAAFQAHDYKTAARTLDRVSRAAPDSADTWRLLGASRAQLQDWKGSRRAYEKLVKLEPDDAAAHAGLGLALARLKDAQAQAQLEWLKAKAQACGAGCADADQLKRYADEVAAALAGAPAAPGPSALLDSRPMLFAGAQAGDAAYVSAVGLINAGRYDDALQALGEAQAAFGPHPDILTYQGYAWRKKGVLPRAEAYYRQALAVAPHHRGAMEYYGELKVERGDLAGARALLARLDRICAFGCAEAEELRRWIALGHAPSS